MSTKGYGSITLTDVLDGAQIWTTTTAPTSPNYTFTISNLSGDSAATIREGDLIFYSYYRYTVAEVGTTTVLATNRQSLRGANGTNGLNTATVFLYQRSASQPAQPNFSSTYTFSTKTLGGIPSGNAWSQTIETGTNPVYMVFATASSSTDTDTIPASEWSNAVKLTGEDGVSGYNQATIFLYRRYASQPSKPTAKPTYTFATGALSAIPTDWSRTIPTNDGKPCWVTTTTAISQSSSATVGTWSDVVKLAEDGFTPTVTATRSGNTTTITITNSTGTSTTDIEDGERGATWYAGTAITGRSGTETAFPNSGVANAIIGDHYLNTSTQNVYVCTTPGTPSVAKWVYEQNIKGETGATGDKGYIHIKYSNDGGTTFTGNGGEDPGDWMGVYSDNTQADSTSVSAYQWVKIRGLSVEKIEKEYCLVNSDTAVPSGTTWSSTMPDYESGKWYWSREVTTWSDGSTTNGEAILEVATTEALHRASLGLGMKINYSSFSNTDPGEVYLHGYTNGEPADVNGFVYWKDVKRTVNKGMINPNTIVPYNRYIYIVLRLTNATATTGALRIVWYNSGWKYAIPPTPTKVEGGWEWIENRDVVLGQFIEPGPESDVVEAYLYNPPRSASQVVTTNASPYQYSQAAVEWNASYGGRVKNATDMLAEWAAGDFATTTEIDGGHIATNTIEAKHFVGDHIVSSNWEASDNESSPYTVTGTCFDLITGNLMMPNFGIDNTYGKVYLNGGIYFLDGYIGNSENNNYWKVGTKVDYNADQKAFFDGIGNVYIQTGEFQLSNGLLDTRHYDAQNKITYPVYDNTYWDFGVQSPILDSSTTGYVSGVDDNFIYIRKHANTIPSLKTDWDYIFRVDKNGMVYINGQSLDERYALRTSSSDYVLKNPSDGGTQTVNSPLTVTGLITGTATQATQLTHWISINGTQWNGSSNTTIGTLGVGYGGTGATSFTSGAALIGNGSGAIQTRSITNNTTATYITGSTNLITANTLKFFNGAYDSSHNSNLEYVKLGKLGTVVTHDYDDFITVDGGIIDGSLQVTDLTAGNLIVTGAGRFTNGMYGDLTGNASTADKVNHDLIIKLNGGTTEGTNMFTFNGSAAKTVNVTKSAIGLGNVENTALSTWAGSSNLTTTKVGTLAGAAIKAVDTSISAGSTSTNLPTSAAVASFVEGKGYVTSSGVTSVRVQATSPVVSSVNTAQSSSLNTTISLADGYGDTKNPYGTKTVNYVLAGPASGSTAAAPSFRALVAADIPTLASSKVGLGNVTNNKQVKGLASGTTSGHLVSWGSDGYTVADSGYSVSQVDKTVTSLTSNNDGKIVLTYLDGTTSNPIEVKIIGSSGSSVSYADALNVNGSAVGSATVPVYIDVNGKPQTANTIPKLNNATTGGTFYAPISVGTSGQYLKSNGSGAPTWTTFSKSTVGLGNVDNTADANKNVLTATKFSSARTIALSGDVTGSASSDGTNGWSVTTKADRLSTVGDNSSTATLPTDYSDKLIFQGLKTNSVISKTTVKDKVPYNFRTSGSSADISNREYDEIVGGSLVWNQLIDKAYFINNSNSGITLTADSNTGKITVSGTATATASLVFVSNNPIRIPPNHVCYMAQPTGASGSTFWIRTGEDTFWNYKTIAKNTTTGTPVTNVRMLVGSGQTVDFTFYPQFFDLTKMFGSTIADYIYSLEQTTAGAGVAFFRKLFPKDYYAYNAGTMMHVSGLSSHDMVGFNQWDEVWEVGAYSGANGAKVATNDRIRSKNKIRVFPGTSYYIKSEVNIQLYEYGINEEYIRQKWSGSKNTIYSASNDAHYITFNTAANTGITYKNDICINLSWDGERNGEYESYVKHSYPLDDSLTLRGIPKLDSSNNLYYDGDTYAADGTVTRKYGIVDLGTLNWEYDGDEIFRSNIYTAKYKGLGICSKYQVIQVGSWSQVGDKQMSVTNSQNQPMLRIHDSSMGTDAAAFKTAMSGVYLVYELATPTTEEAEPYNEVQIVDDFGTEEYVTTSLVPVGHNTKYVDSLTESSNTSSYIIGLRGYTSGKSHELAFNNSGIFRREGASTEWGSWSKLIDSSNYMDYTVTHTGVGAYGKWDIDISGNSETSTKWELPQTVYVKLDTVSTTTTIQGGSSTAQTIGINGTLAVGNGGTGKTTAKDAANAFIDALEAGSSVPLDGDTYIASYADGKNTAHNGTNTYHRRPISQLYSYIKGKTDSVYAALAGATFTGAVTGTSFGASSYMSVNTGNSGTAGGLALYGTSPTNYGIAMRNTSNGGKHGFVQGDWGIYNYCSASANVVNRGWIWNYANTAMKSVASLSGEGHMVLNGSLTVGGNTTNTSGCKMEFNSTLNCLAFVFN